MRNILLFPIKKNLLSNNGLVTPGQFGTQKVSLMTLGHQQKNGTPCAFLLSVCYWQEVRLQMALERAGTPAPAQQCVDRALASE